MSELKYTAQTSKAVHEAREAAGLPWLFNGGTVSGDLPGIHTMLQPSNIGTACKLNQLANAIFGFAASPCWDWYACYLSPK
jgi:hypothetical protein